MGSLLLCFDVDCDLGLEVYGEVIIVYKTPVSRDEKLPIIGNNPMIGSCFSVEGLSLREAVIIAV